MINNLRFELSFKNISQLENKLNFCKSNNIRNINVPCKGPIKKELFNETIKLPISFIVGSSFILGSILGNFIQFNINNE